MESTRCKVMADDYCLCLHLLRAETRHEMTIQVQAAHLIEIRLEVSGRSFCTSDDVLSLVPLITAKDAQEIVSLCHKAFKSCMLSVRKGRHVDFTQSS